MKKPREITLRAMYLNFLFLFSVGFFPPAVAADAAKAPAAKKSLAPHVHGEGNLKFVFDLEKNVAELSFEFPAVQVLGFEHKPVTQSEISIYNQTQVMLNEPKSLFLLLLKKNEKSGCVFGKSSMSVPFNDKKGAKAHDHGDHQDYELQYKLTCKNLKAVRGLRISAFKVLFNFEKLKVEGLVGSKPYSLVLTQSKDEFEF
ncbi:MAG: DUF2796 domain-containing protein [Bdellovibrionota bacterium]